MASRMMFERDEDQFRTHYDGAYANLGYAYEEYRPAYYFGYELASDERYRDRADWDTLEPEIAREWQDAHPAQAWDDFKDAVRHAWEAARRA